MKTIKLIGVLIIVLASTSLFAQQQIIPDPKPFIDVTGTAEKEIIPDEIYISITLKERTEGMNKESIQEQEARLTESFTNIGIPSENLEMSHMDADYIRVKWGKKDVIARSEYTLMVSDAATVGKVFEKLDELKIEDAYISKVDHSKMDEFKKEVRILAIKAAKEKADYLLEAIGEETGKPMQINENNPHYTSNAVANVSGVRGARSEGQIMEFYGKSKHIIEFEKIKLKASYFVKFGIK